MAPSWCKHFNELVNGPQMLPQGPELFCQLIEKTTLFKNIRFH